MKIAFATIGDTRDIRRGSGTPHYLWQELLRQGHTVHLVGPLNVKTPMLTRLFKKISTISGKRYLSYRDPFMGRALGKEAKRALRGMDVDVVLTNDYCLAGYLQTEIPLVLYTDDNFPINYNENVHPWLAGLSNYSIHFCIQTTARGIGRADACFFASQFASDEARKYMRNRDFAVIPYGANIPDPGPRPARTVDAIRQKGNIDLLFIGKDWERKGGDLAVEITRLLNQRGLKAHLHVAGVDLSGSYSDSCVTFYGLLNKDDARENAMLDKLFSTCDILLVPSKAEGYGLVFVEAAAYGMPSLAYANTGVQTAVEHDVSGVLFNSSEDVESFVVRIQSWFSEPKTFESLSKTAREHFEKNGNWSRAVSRLMRAIEPLLGQ